MSSNLLMGERRAWRRRAERARQKWVLVHGLLADVMLSEPKGDRKDMDHLSDAIEALKAFQQSAEEKSKEKA